MRVGNLTDKSVVITWETARPTIGSVLYAPAGTGTVNATSARTAFDLRGTGFTGETHYVRIAGLLPSTDYPFVLSSSGQITDNGGAPYAFRTGPPLLAPLLPDALGGRLVDEAGVPAGGCLVFVQVIDGDSAGSRGSSAWLATLSEAGGEWLIEVGARTSDLQNEFAYQIGAESLAVESRCGSRGNALPWLPDLGRRCEDALRPPARPHASSELRVRTSPPCPPFLSRTRRGEGGGGSPSPRRRGGQGVRSGWGVRSAATSAPSLAAVVVGSACGET